MAAGHVPVMVERILHHLEAGACAGAAPRVWVDGTVGAGGHAEAILERSSPDGRLVGVDRDPAALRVARERLARFGDRVALVRGDFADLPAILAGRGVAGASGLLVDLGVSSMQLDDPSRGFSLRGDGPLDMRMDPDASTTAADVLDDLGEADLAEALGRLGGERMAGRVARVVLGRRREGRLRTTADLREAVHAALRRARTGRIDSATRSFQALRMLTNREIESLESLLDRFVGVLRPGGRAVFVSFHSEEDGRVKRAFRMLAAPGGPEGAARIRILTKRVERPAREEILANPRARSAKLRAAERLAEAA